MSTLTTIPLINRFQSIYYNTILTMSSMLEVSDSTKEIGTNKTDDNRRGSSRCSIICGWAVKPFQKLEDDDDDDSSTTCDLTENLDNSSYEESLGCGDATPDLGYGNATAPDANDLGYYGEEATTTTPVPADLGYGDDTPDLGYGDDTAPGDLGYGDDTPDLGYGDRPTDRTAARRRCTNPMKQQGIQRRCSVTKFSLEVQQAAEQQQAEDKRQFLQRQESMHSTLCLSEDSDDDDDDDDSVYSSNNDDNDNDGNSSDYYDSDCSDYSDSEDEDH